MNFSFVHFLARFFFGDLLFADLARRRLAAAPEDGPAVAEAAAGLLRDFEPAPLAAALLADRFACPLGAAA